MKILEVNNLCKNYGKGTTLVKALDDVSFSVEEGDFVAIVGSSGSGKSVAGLFKVTTDDAGHITSATAVQKSDISPEMPQMHL